jgi:DNA polymerase-3 subunit chi
MANTATNEPAKQDSPQAPQAPRVDFYVSKDSSSDSGSQFTLLTACRIAEKALTAGHRIHIRMRSNEECEKLDALMWTFRDRSFIPHELSSDPIDSCPVTISSEINEKHVDMLLNVAHEVPENIKQFQRIAEIIDNQPESINAGRERYRVYRENGLDPQHHEVSSA